jgi:hypothetical protein
VIYSTSIPYVPEDIPPPPSYVPSYAPAYPPSSIYIPPAPAYPPQPTETIIELPGGRYELRGDGVTVPYRWVAPSVAPPAPPQPTRRADIYRWTDSDGVVHLTDRLDEVPEAYRSQATKSPS